MRPGTEQKGNAKYRYFPNPDFVRFGIWFVGEWFSFERALPPTFQTVLLYLHFSLQHDRCLGTDADTTDRSRRVQPCVGVYRNQQRDNGSRDIRLPILRNANRDTLVVRHQSPSEKQYKQNFCQIKF